MSWCGEGDAQILVVDPGPPNRIFAKLRNGDDGPIDVSPDALRRLRHRVERDSELQASIADATTPEPLRPVLTRPLLDAWSMTSLKEHTKRPEVAPWIRGLVDDEPQTAVIWRQYLPVRANDVSVKEQEIEAFFEAAPPHISEMLETETYRVVNWLLARANAKLSAKSSPATEESLLRDTDTVAYALSTAGDLRKKWALKQLRATDKKVRQSLKEELLRRLPGATLIVDSRIGGLSDKGMLDGKTKDRPRTADDGNGWLEADKDSNEAWSASTPPVIRFRVYSPDKSHEETKDNKEWWERFRFAAEQTDEGEVTRWLIVDKWRYDAANEEDRSVSRKQTLEEHQEWAARKARELAERIGLPKPYPKALDAAARLH